MANEVQRQLANSAYWKVGSSYPRFDFAEAKRWARDPRLDFDKRTAANGLARVRELYAAWQQNGASDTALRSGASVSGRPEGLTRVVVDRRTTLLGRRKSEIYTLERGGPCLSWEEFEEQAPAMLEVGNKNPPIVTRLHTSASAGEATLISRRIILVDTDTAMGWEVTDVAGQEREPEPYVVMNRQYHVGGAVLRGLREGSWLRPGIEVIDHFAAGHLVIPTPELSPV
jgi:hypothetical protein